MGCPHTCVFCNQRKIAGSFPEPTKESIRETVYSYRRSFRDVEKAYIELAFYGGSFTGIREDLQEELLLAAFNLKAEKLIDGIRLSTRPDYISPKVIERLNRYGVTSVELGVQSLADDVLISSQRGHSARQVGEAVKLLKDARIQVGIQLMPGLPQDSVAKVLATTKKVIELKPDFVRIYPTVVIKDTQLAQWLKEGVFKPWELETAVETAAMMLIFFNQADIPVIRLGLQATENLVFGHDLLDGPYHPAFGELVKARVYRKQIEYFLTEKALLKNKNISLLCNTKDISQIKGQNRANILYFQDKYNLNIVLVPNEEIETGSIAYMENNDILVFSRREFLDKYRNKIVY